MYFLKSSLKPPVAEGKENKYLKFIHYHIILTKVKESNLLFIMYRFFMYLHLISDIFPVLIGDLL